MIWFILLWLGDWKDDSRIVNSQSILDYSNSDTAVKPVEGTTKKYYKSGISGEKSIANEYYQVLLQHNRGGFLAVAAMADERFYWSDVIDELLLLKAVSNTANYSENEEEEDKGSTYKVRIISDLASYFRENSHDKVRQHKTGLKDGKNIQIQNMIMYAVLVGQSLILFIAYIKRLFYVIMLAMIAPVVVVVDFFQKFGK